MARPEKVAKTDALKATFDTALSVVLNDFTGLNVDKISELRRLCREAGVHYTVVKNTLAKLGVKETKAAELEQYFEGPTALAISTKNENDAAKILAKFAEEHQSPTFKAGFVDGRVIDASAVLTLSKLPSKDELLSMVLAGIQSPATGLVSVLQGTARNLVGVLNQVKDKLE